jgi:hypothetical protein
MVPICPIAGSIEDHSWKFEGKITCGFHICFEAWVKEKKPSL